MGAAAWERQRGSCSVGAAAWGCSVGAAAWERQRGSGSVERVGAAAWERQRGSGSVGAAAWERQRGSGSVGAAAWMSPSNAQPRCWCGSVIAWRRLRDLRRILWVTSAGKKCGSSAATTPLACVWCSAMNGCARSASSRALVAERRQVAERRSSCRACRLRELQVEIPLGLTWCTSRAVMKIIKYCHENCDSLEA